MEQQQLPPQQQEASNMYLGIGVVIVGVLICLYYFMIYVPGTYINMIKIYRSDPGWLHIKELMVLDNDGNNIVLPDTVDGPKHKEDRILANAVDGVVDGKISQNATRDDAWLTVGLKPTPMDNIAVIMIHNRTTSRWSSGMLARLNGTIVELCNDGNEEPQFTHIITDAGEEIIIPVN